jgi:hypothetical protein
MEEEAFFDDLGFGFSRKSGFGVRLNVPSC